MKLQQIQGLRILDFLKFVFDRCGGKDYLPYDYIEKFISWN